MSPFSLQISRSRANIKVFNSITAKLGTGEHNAYDLPVGLNYNHGVVTQERDEDVAASGPPRTSGVAMPEA